MKRLARIIYSWIRASWAPLILWSAENQAKDQSSHISSGKLGRVKPSDEPRQLGHAMVQSRLLLPRLLFQSVEAARHLNPGSKTAGVELARELLAKGKCQWKKYVFSHSPHGKLGARVAGSQSHRDNLYVWVDAWGILAQITALTYALLSYLSEDSPLRHGMSLTAGPRVTSGSYADCMLDPRWQLLSPRWLGSAVMLMIILWLSTQ